MIYFTSDTHFYNKKALKIGSKKFASSVKRDDYIIEQWNKVVGDKDEVYLLGDISNGTGAQTNEVLKRLNGTKYLIIGNNDRYLDDPEFDKELFGWCKNYHVLYEMETKFILFHFPIEVWEGYGNDRFHLHGHLHRKKAIHEPIRRYEVGVDAHDARPVSIEEIYKSIKEFHNESRKIQGFD